VEYQYVAYNTEKKIIKGRLAAPDEEKAVGQLSTMGYQVLNIKSLGSLGKLTKSLDISFTAQIKPKK